LIATLGALAVVIVYMTESHKRESSFSVQATQSTTQSTVPTKQAWGNEKAKTSGTSTAAPRPAVRNDMSPATLFTAADRLSFQKLERGLGGTSGVAASEVGLNRSVSELGTLHEGVAWSTIKVPIALAVEARSGGRPTAAMQALLAQAVSASDNSAAEALWAGLGSPAAAAATVHSVLAASGDTLTTVETQVLRPGFTSFGQTDWPLAAQQRFIAGLPCLANSRPVLSLMRQVVPDQRWGIGTLPFETQFKGGWGPDPDGRYLVRQMGIVRLSNGRFLAASIATMPADGGFATGTANLSQIAQWLMAHVDSSRLSRVRCR
jgi:hypothetical protein